MDERDWPCFEIGARKGLNWDFKACFNYILVVINYILIESLSMYYGEGRADEKSLCGIRCSR